jgi:dolichol-phosphate mannosyltransferase
MRCLVIIPTFNERDNIVKLLDKVLARSESLEVLVVDDNSPDKTYQLVTDYKKNNSRVHLIKRAGKLGLGSAYVTGFKYAIKKGYDCIIQMDADFSHNPAVINKMLKEIQHNDCVIGSRYLSGINVINWPFMRLFISYMAAQYVRIITGLPVKDPTGGFKCIRIEALKAINLDKILSDGYSFQIEMTYRIWLKNFRVREIPIVFTERRLGKSKLSKRIVREAVFMVWKLKILAMLDLL